MKKLHRLILNSFVGPFSATFFVVLFVLLMQFLWKYIDDLVGKGLEWTVIGELLFYASATLVPLALPLAILVSSIMTMGNLAEHYELVAAKASGISLRRIMMPLVFIAIMISMLAFVFSNYLLPYTNLKMGSLLYDVKQQKPAFYIQEGIFYNGIDGYSIKVGRKDTKDQTLYDVMIYDHTARVGNNKVILAEKGTMQMSEDEKFLIINLSNGYSYEEQQQSGNSGGAANPLLRTHFSNYNIKFDLSTFKLNRTNEELFKDNYQMLNLGQLKNALDSLTLQLREREASSNKIMTAHFLTFRDSLLWKKDQDSALAVSTTTADPNAVFETALGQARNIKSFLESMDDELDSRYKLIYRYAIEKERKYTLSIACFILFLIGAPLGAIIRKGGIGMPVVVSVVFFLIFHITSIMGEKFSREGVIDTAVGMWIAPSLLLPIGLFLTYKATHDSALFDAEAYTKFFKRVFRKKA